MKKNILLIMLLILMPILLFSANTSIRISSFTRNINLNYDMNGGAEITQSLTLKHKGDAMDYFLTFSSGSSALWNNRTVIYSGSLLNYQVYRESSKINILKDLSDNPSANEVLSGSFAQSGSFQFITLSYTIYVPMGQFDLAGVYNDAFDVTLYSGNLAVYTREGSKSHGLKVTMPASLELSLTPTGSPFNDTAVSLDMNFGILTAGSSRSADAVVRTNSPYSIFIQSEKMGKLTHLNPAISDIVPYTFTFDGNVIDLTGTTPMMVVSGATVTPYEGARYPINVTIGNFGMASEGVYEDNLTITIQAQ